MKRYTHSYQACCDQNHTQRLLSLNLPDWINNQNISTTVVTSKMGAILKLITNKITTRQ